MKKMLLPELTTPRLILRKVEMTDLHNYHKRLTSDPKVAEYMLWNSRDDIAHTQTAIQRILNGYEEGARYHWPFR